VERSIFIYSHKKAMKALSSLVVLLVVGSTIATLTSLKPSQGLAVRSQCSDGIDNDNDGRIDYPEDDDCEDLDDDFEGLSRSGFFLSITDGAEEAAPNGALNYRITLKQQRDTYRQTRVDAYFPPDVEVLSASNGARIGNDGIVHWDNVGVDRDVIKVLTVNATVRTTAKQDQLLVARVTVPGEDATDTTRVETEKEIKGHFYLSLSDKETYIEPGRNLSYSLRVKNGQNIPATTDVRVDLAHDTNYVNASIGSQLENNNVIAWRDIAFAAGEERTFTFTVFVQNRSSQDFLLRTRAIAGGSTAVDETQVRRGLPYTALSVSIDDGKEAVERGQLLTYTVRVRNNSPTLGTDENVNVSLPVFSEFVDATEGGVWDGQNVRWNHLQIAPNGVRNLQYTIRVRSDAPIGDELLASAQVRGEAAADYTSVATFAYDGGFDGVDPSLSTRTASDLLLRKVAASDEVVPGGKVRYTIYVDNIYDHPIHGATVSDRFDSSNLTFADGDAIVQGDGQLLWNVPDLAPGETWKTSYVLSVSNALPRGTVLTNIATINGPDIDQISLTERVRTVRTGVITGMPRTGAAMDVLMTALSSGAAVSIGGFQFFRRRMLGA
jgi:hypothetical protein